jgi:hypothetical protein
MAVRQARFRKAEIERLQANPEYDYDRDLHVDILWWDRLKELIQRKLRDLFGTKAGSWVFDHLHWFILLIAIVVLLVYFRKRLFHGGFAIDATRPRQVLEITEDLPRLDLDRLLAEAERGSRWRDALRCQYLLVLRRLIDDGLIRFQPDSTDLEYQRQLKDPAKRRAFAEISFLFKWAWYGDAPMDEARYRSLAPSFVELHTPAGRP